MSRARAHRPVALAATAVGLVAAFLAGTCGPIGLAAGGSALLLGYGRSRRWAVSPRLERPRLFGILGAVYLPFFLADLFALSFGRPLEALTRLVVYLIAAESLAGDGRRRSYRPLLLGLLLLVAAAAETTEVWFAVPLFLFLLAAVRAQIEDTSVRDAPGGATRPPVTPVATLVSTCAVALVMGAAFFLVIPRLGAGWARQPVAHGGQAGIETGLAESVDLAMVGRVKRRTTIVLRVALDHSRVDPATLYWRARTYTRWTGSGWEQETDRAQMVYLPARRRVHLARAPASAEPLVADIRVERRSLDVLPLPGRPLWARCAEGTHLVAHADGTFSGLRGMRVPRFEIAVDPGRDPRKPMREGESDGGPSRALLDAGELDDEVRAWAMSVLPTAASALELARAFERDLRARPYSLDTRGIDPARPVASFLAGAPAHCEYFATAMALGLRARGVPARVVGGYFGTDPLPFSSWLAVRESRAHLWVEAYLPGTGWSRFDPTPDAGRIPEVVPLGALRAGWEGIVLAWDSWVIGLDLRDQRELVDGLREALARAMSLLPLSGLLAVVALGVGLVVAGRIWRHRQRARPRRGGAVPEPFARLAALARRSGIEVRAHETARELASRLTPVLEDGKVAQSLCRAYERDRFGARATR